MNALASSADFRLEVARFALLQKKKRVGAVRQGA
jgi:hypothetical protein